MALEQQQQNLWRFHHIIDLNSISNYGSITSLKVRIGEWESDTLSIYIDGIPWETKWGYTEGNTRLCNGPSVKGSDKVFDVEFEVNHNSPTLTIVIATT